MQNFDYHNPTRIIFGTGTIARLAEQVEAGTTVMLVYGGGSIFSNGVYRQVTGALEHCSVVEFGGIMPNPTCEICIEARETAVEHGAELFLAVGGGSVIDATKLIAASMGVDGDPWDIVKRSVSIESAPPVGVVVTLPASGSETNNLAVISSAKTGEKLSFSSPHLYPRFAILDPETTYSLPERQTRNGILDAFCHVMEQYLTYPAAAPLQDRFAESILRTLIEEGPGALENPGDYDTRANIMWAASCALNGFIACGVPQDWSTHIIGHELTAEYEIDHAATVAVCLLGVMAVMKEQKKEKILRYGRRVLGLAGTNDDELVDAAITGTRSFFESLGQETRLSKLGAPEDAPETIARRIGRAPRKFGEKRNIGQRETRDILALVM